MKQDYSDSSKCKIVKKLADGGVQAAIFSGSDKFRIETYYVMIDKLVAELQKRSEAYNYITDLFGFLMHLLVIDNDNLEIKAKKLVEVHADDLNDELYTELQQFIVLLKLQNKGFFSCHTEQANKENDEMLSPIKVLNWIVENDLIQAFPITHMLLTDF